MKSTCLLHDVMLLLLLLFPGPVDGIPLVDEVARQLGYGVDQLQLLKFNYLITFDPDSTSFKIILSLILVEYNEIVKDSFKHFDFFNN